VSFQRAWLIYYIFTNEKMAASKNIDKDSKMTSEEQTGSNEKIVNEK